MTKEWEESATQGAANQLLSQIEAGVDFDSRNAQGQTALMLSARHGHLEAVRVLVRAGVDLDATAKYGLSAIMLAVINGHGSVARALASAGADLRLTGSGAPGFAGKTVVQLARERGDQALAEFLSVARSAAF